MLKLPKGLKKKKKDKKSKKNQELFTEEELEQFKREQKARQLAEEEAKQKEEEAAAADSSAKPKTDEDEWSKFNQLTTGIDSILKKTQGDLDRIKESSFFQRVAPKKVEPKSNEVKSEPEKSADASEDNTEEPEGAAALTEEELEEQRKLASLKEAVIELSESEEESEEADDIFDTNYIDTLTSGNVPLAYVPESPDELEAGPDPFDTAYAEKVIKGPEVSKRGKKIVNIGSAVEVLTGRVEKVSASGLKRPRRGPQNLLLESFDKGEGFDPAEDVVDSLTASKVAEERPVLTLLDDPADEVVDAPIDLSASLHLQYLKQKEEEEKEAERQRLELEKLKELEKDEFDDLAAESLNKKEEVTVVDSKALYIAPVLETETDWSEFEAEVKEVDVDEFALDEDAAEVDPFDTDFVTTVIREKSVDDDDFDFDPRADERRSSEVKVAAVVVEPTLSVLAKDLLSGSTTDLSDLSHIPVILASDSVEKEIDPFDTSAVTAIVQPKETEIKFLEKELLSDVGLKHSLSDPDFDPRGGEETVVVPRPSIPCVVTTTAERKSSLSLNIGAAAPHKSVAFVVSENLLAESSGDSKIHKPLTPYYSEKSIGAVNEPLSDLSDSDFDPRANEQIEQTNKPDLLCVDEAHDIKVLTPATGEQSNPSADDTYAVDPFDTSNVSIALLPGKAELKLIENELIEAAKTPETAVLDINSDSQELGLGAKVLTPQITLPVDDSFDDGDPFDTSFACNIAPGKAEIKVLESELIHK